MAGKEEIDDMDLEDPIIRSPMLSKKRKKVIGLDELLADFYQEQSKNLEKEAQRKELKSRNSDEVLDTKEASLSKLVDQCQVQVNEIGGEEDASLWGIPIFGDQRSSPTIATPGLENCGLLRSFMNNKVCSLVELSSENGDSFIERLLVCGWLSKLVETSGHLEESVAKWTGDLMLYSPKEELRASACNFWCAVLSSSEESVKMDWFPGYQVLKKALEVYGYVFLSDAGTSNSDTCCGGPPQNIRSWIRFVTVSCQVRKKWSFFSASEVEELLEVVICLFLDRQLQGLSVILYECMQALVSYFTDKEWKSGCDKVAKCLVNRVPKDLNCIRMVESVSGVDDRCKHLRSVLAYQILLGSFGDQGTGDEVLRSLIAIKLKERSCDLFKVYIYLVLSENWLLSDNLLDREPVLKEMWGLFLRNCSCLIASTDLRAFAPKIRNKASFLLQGAARF